MQSKLLKSAPWPLLIGGKFLQVYPVGTILAVLLALPSQIALVVAFLLPIKIVMLMASEGVPRFMPAIASSIDKSSLIIILSALSVIAFFFNQIANKAIDKIARSGMRRLEQRNQKLHLFDGQENLLENSYTRYVDTVASSTFVLLGLLALSYLYPEISAVIVLYTSICIVTPIFNAVIQKVETEKITNQVQKALPTLSAIGFFLIFLSVVIDYISFEIPESFIKILISVILGRQILNRISIVTKNLFFFHRQKNKLKALLFHGVALEIQGPQNSSAMTFLSETGEERISLNKVISSIVNEKITDHDLTWIDSGLKGITILQKKLQHQNQTLLIKIFDRRKAADARQEAALLLAAPKGLPSPELLKTTIISGFHIHFFDISEYRFLNHTTLNAARSRITDTLAETQVPQTLLSRYKRSHTMLWEKLPNLNLHQIELAFPGSQAKIQSFKLMLPSIQEKLKTLPLRFNNHHLNNRHLYLEKSNGDINFLHWGKWSIEPLGVSFSNTKFEDLEHWSAKEELTRETVPTQSDNIAMIIAAMTKRLFREIHQQSLASARDTLSELTLLMNR